MELTKLKKNDLLGKNVSGGSSVKTAKESDKGIDIDDCHAFVRDCETERNDWLTQARASWREIKKQDHRGKLFAVDMRSARKKIHYPIWNSTLNIRRPLVFGRNPIITGTDTATGDDPIGRTAAIIYEKLAKSIMKTFPFGDVMSAVRDDGLITNLGQGRAYYDCEWRTEKVKEFLTVKPIDDQRQILVDSNGKEVTDTDDVIQDEEGIYILTDKEVEVEYERVYFKHILYSDFYVDPDATDWDDVKRVAFAWDYSERDFKKTFGARALEAIPEISVKKTAESKRTVIRVYEYWDIWDREVKYFAEGGVEFLPKPSKKGDGRKYDEESAEVEKSVDDPYELDKFFPCPEPMLFNAPTDSFYPITEFYQQVDLLDDMHEIASKIYQITKAIRPRLFFDSSVPGLQDLINNAATGDAIGVADLAASLAGKANGILDAVQYLPLRDMVDSLVNYSQAFQTKKAEFYELTGTSDLLRGMTDGVERTFGEQQLKAKYAMNQIEPIQRDMQRYCRDALELLCEMALKNFKDETLREYVPPSSLDPEDQQRYQAGLVLLKDDKKRRFRLDIETDSTVALNEEFNKSAVTEATNALTKAVDYTAQTIERVPYLGPPMIKMVQELVKSFRIGKQVADEIDTAFKAAMEKAEQAANAQPPPIPPDPNALKLEWEKEKWQLEQPERIGKLNMEHQYRMGVIAAKNGDQQVKMYQINTDAASAQQALEVDVLGIKTDGQVQTERTQIQAQLQQAETAAANQIESMKLQLEYQAQEDKKILETGKAILSKQQIDLDASFRAIEQELDSRRVALENATHMLNAQERVMEEKRLSLESQIQLLNIGKEVSQFKASNDLAKAELLHKMNEVATKSATTSSTASRPRARKRKLKLSDDPNADIEIEEID